MKCDTSVEKLLAKRGRGMIFNNDNDTTSLLSEPCTPESHRSSNEDINDEDNNDFWM
jgi:hypothetical protein